MGIKELVLILQNHQVNNQIIYVILLLNTQQQNQLILKLLKILNFLGLLIPTPTNPTARPGRSEIDIEIYPARIGNINPKAVSPVVLKKAANGVFLPKLLGSIV